MNALLREQREVGSTGQPQAACCSLLPEGLGPEAVRAVTSLCCLLPKAGWQDYPVKEEERGNEKQGVGEQQPYVGSWVVHQEEFWFW